MKISTKFNLIVGFFFVFVFVAVFYSYCGGLHVCYSFPFFNGFGPRKAGTRVTMTSYILESKPDMSRDEEEDLLKHTSSALKTLYFQNKYKKNKHGPAKNADSPSYITGEVAKEILRKANVSEEEANRELYREEKVDKTVDRENSSAPGHHKMTAVTDSREKSGARERSFNAHPIRKPPRRAKRPMKSSKTRSRSALKWKEAYKYLLKELERQENMTENTVENRTKKSKQNKNHNFKETNLKSEVQKSSSSSVTENASKEQKRKFSKKNKIFVNEAIDISDLQQTSRQAIAKDFDKLNKEKDIQSKVFESGSHIIKISNSSVVNRFRNSSEAYLLNTHKPNANNSLDLTTSSMKKVGKNPQLSKEHNNNKPRPVFVDKEIPEKFHRTQNDKDTINKNKVGLAETGVQDKGNKPQTPTIVTPGNVNNKSSKLEQNSHQELQNHKFDERSLNQKRNINGTKDDMAKIRSNTSPKRAGDILDTAQKETATKDQSLAINDQNGGHVRMKAIDNKEAAETVRRDDKNKGNDVSLVEHKTESIKHREFPKTKIDKSNLTSHSSKDTSTFPKGHINHTNTEKSNTKSTKANVKTLAKDRSNTTIKSPTAEPKHAEDGSGEEPKSKTISLQELTRSVRNIKDASTRRALTQALENDEQRIQRLANDIKVVRERRNQPFVLSRVLRDLVTRPDFIPEELDDEDDIFKRSAPESNKALFRVKRVKLGVPNSREKSSKLESALTRVKRVDLDALPDSNTNSDKPLLRVKRKELDDGDITNTNKMPAKDAGYNQRKPASENNPSMLPDDQIKNTADKKIRDVSLANKNDLVSHGLKNDGDNAVTKLSDFDLSKQMQHNTVSKLSSQTTQTFPNEKATQNDSKQNIAALKINAPQITTTITNHTSIGSKNGLQSRTSMPVLNSKKLEVSHSKNVVYSAENELQQHRDINSLAAKEFVGTTKNINTAEQITKSNISNDTADVVQTVHQAHGESDKELIRVKRG